MCRRFFMIPRSAYAAVALVLAFTAGPALTAGATVHADAGGLAVSLTAHLPAFPCPACAATASGSGTGVVTAVDAITRRAVVAVFARAGYSEAFIYHEACSIVRGEPVPPPEGFANGIFTLGPGRLVGVPGSAFLTGKFNYTRVGLALIITTSNVQLHSGSPTGPTIGPVTLGAAAGAWVPLQASGNCKTLFGSPATIGIDFAQASAG